MKYLVYRCFDCGHQEVSRDMDGRRCNNCSGHIKPIGVATDEEVRQHQDKRWRIDKVGGLTVTVSLQPWFSVLQEEIVKAVKVAAEAGMPERLAYEIACYTVERAVKSAVSLK